MAYDRAGKEYDVAVGGVPFRLATMPDLPQSIETISVRKEQFDTERDPGEQSLSGYWRRSQSSFHHGAGFLYEPSTPSDTAFAGFYDSSGVDVFEPGRLTLQRKMYESADTALAFTVKSFNATTYINTLDNVRSMGTTATPNSGTTLITPADVSWVQDFCLNGTTIFLATDSDRLIKSTTTAPGTQSYWVFDTTGLPGSGTGYTVLWAKHRMWVTRGSKIWQPDVSGSGDSGAVPLTPIFTNPQPGWNYYAMVEGPSAVYFAGHDGTQSYIQSITLDSSGALPTLSGATVAAALPLGEKVEHLAIVAGQYIGIGTTEGFRVGRIESNGSITYGPLIIARDPDRTDTFQGVTALAPHSDSFVVAAPHSNDTLMAYKVNISEALDDLVYPYAPYYEDTTYTGYYQSLDVRFGSTPQVFGATLNGTRLYYESTTDNVTSGWIQSSRIRYYTSERKAFKYVDVGVSDLPTGTSVAVSVVDVDESVTAIATIDTLAEAEVGYPITLDPTRYLSVKLTLGGTTALTPRVDSFLLRAIPAVTPQRLISLPLLCFDYEQGRSGQRYGGEGFAQERLADLQALEDTAATVAYENFSQAGTPTEVDCVIEAIRFTQTSVPHLGHEGAGGILLLQLRTVSP